MQIISHRGNTNGPDKGSENNPDVILYLLRKNIDCEIDVWFINNKFYLGHDKPQYEVKYSFLESKGLWCHAKNLEALHEMNIKKNIHFFWHDKDDFTLTSENIIWTYPNKKTTNASVIVDLDKNWRDKNYNCFGVCVDWI